MEIRPIFSALLRNKTAPLIVSIQIAISLAILANALYIINFRMETAARPSGIADESSIVSVRISLNRDMNPQDNSNFMKQMLLAVNTVPGVIAAAQVSQLPLSQSGWETSINLDAKQTEASAMVSLYQSPDSLIKTLGLKLLAGRDFNSADVIEQDPDVGMIMSKKVIITRALAQRLFPNDANAIGKTFYWGGGTDATPATIIGVIERLQTPNAQTKAEGEYSVITPNRPGGSRPIFVIQSEKGQRDRVIADVESALRKADAHPMRIVTTTAEQYRKNRYRNDMALAWMLIVVSALLLLITASGIVGMTSLWVNQRRKQIGVRRALGARKIDILRYFITENIVISSLGIIGGTLLAIGLNQFLVSQLELPKLPVLYLFSGAGMFLLLGLVAAYAPALRAASISPAVATRGT